MSGVKGWWRRHRPYLRARFEFKAADCWVGAFWKLERCPCAHTVCYCNWRHVWICVVPMLPLHVQWLVRIDRRQS